MFGLDALPIGRCGHLTDEIMLFLNNVYAYNTYVRMAKEASASVCLALC